MKEICCHKTLTGLPKHLPKKINQSPRKIYYKTKMTILPKGTTVETTNL